MGAFGLGSRAIVGEFYNQLEVANGLSWLNQIGWVNDNSDQESETYKWLGMTPAMREWVGGRNAKAFRENGLTILNKKFEATLQVTLDEIRRDKTRQVQTRIGELADRVVTHDASLVSTLLLNAGTGVCYDGQFFFDTDHTEGDNTTNQSNAIAYDISDNGTGGTPTAPTARTMQGTILNGVAQIMSFKDDQNEPMNEMARMFLVMSGPALMSYVLAAVSNPVLDSGATNTIANLPDFKISAAINPRLNWTDKIAVFRTDGRTKPFIIQHEVPLEVSAQAEGSDEEFKNDRHLYGVKKIGNAGYGMWQHACQVTMQA